MTSSGAHTPVSICLVEAGEHLLAGCRTLSDDPIEVEREDPLGRVDPIDLDVLLRRDGGALRLFLLAGSTVLACSREDLVQRGEGVGIRVARAVVTGAAPG
jgi:hypothetical protein